eukprot:CAMPEP_0172178698 /NCGR_PEP_ID=MMETSP1050-20130122/16188_1 /TAXON_ID=233186 /ORGANISM="Cryptomonas curvata, Strain CCAP979/52" /LENGTH=154 /DNA_ID=CAMNT_0012851461 /DNA_START=78 /DNA_END=539 /DNA_ORIENTATION=+
MCSQGKGLPQRSDYIILKFALVVLIASTDLVSSPVFAKEQREEDLSSLSVKSLKDALRSLGATCKACTERQELIDALRRARAAAADAPGGGGGNSGGKAAVKGQCRAKSTCNQVHLKSARRSAQGQCRAKSTCNQVHLKSARRSAQGQCRAKST